MKTDDSTGTASIRSGWLFQFFRQKPPDRSLQKYKCFQPFPFSVPSAQIYTIVSFEPRDAALSAGYVAFRL